MPLRFWLWPVPIRSRQSGRRGSQTVAEPVWFGWVNSGAVAIHWLILHGGLVLYLIAPERFDFLSQFLYICLEALYFCCCCID